MGERLITMVQVLERVPVSKAQIYRWIREEKFPRQVHLGPQSVAWRETEVDAFIASRPLREAVAS